MSSSLLFSLLLLLLVSQLLLLLLLLHKYFVQADLVANLYIFRGWGLGLGWAIKSNCRTASEPQSEFICQPSSTQILPESPPAPIKHHYIEMAQKLLLVSFSALLALASSVVVPGPGLALPALPAYPGLALPKLAAPVYPGLAKLAVAKVAAPEPYDPNPQYSFSYDVHVSIDGVGRRDGVMLILLLLAGWFHRRCEEPAGVTQRRCGPGCLLPHRG